MQILSLCICDRTIVVRSFATHASSSQPSLQIKDKRLICSADLLEQWKRLDIWGAWTAISIKLQRTCLMAGRREKSSRHYTMETVMTKKPAAQERMCEGKNAGIFWRSYRTRHGKQSSNVSSEILANRKTSRMVPEPNYIHRMIFFQAFCITDVQRKDGHWSQNYAPKIFSLFLRGLGGGGVNTIRM